MDHSQIVSDTLIPGQRSGVDPSSRTVDDLFAVTVECFDSSVEGVTGNRYADPGHAEFFEGRQAGQVSVNVEVIAGWGAAVGTHKVHVHGRVAPCCLQPVPQIVEHRHQIVTGLKRRGTGRGCQLRRGREWDPSLTLRGDPLAGSSGVPADTDRRMRLLYGFGVGSVVGGREVAALEGHLVARPHGENRVEGLVEEFVTFVELDA